MDEKMIEQAEKTFICDCCGKEHPVSDRHEIHRGDVLCSQCVQLHTVQCSHCGKYLYRDDNEGDTCTPLCYPCFQRLGCSICDRCGRLLRAGEACYDSEDDDIPYCCDCYNRRRSEAIIHDYCYRPVPIFYGKGPRYFGIELEIDGAGERTDYAAKILDAGNCNGKQYIYAKHDGSLDDGFEIVSEAADLNCHLNEIPWGAVLEKAKELKYTSHSAGTCGLHIHVSRLAFGDTEEKQDASIARVLYFVEKHWEEMLKFSRRTPRQLERWATRYGYKERPVEILEHAKKGGHGGRYSCVNLQNRDTIEFRMFRGTLKLNTFIATLQMVNRICDVAIYLSDEELKGMSWSTFMSGITEQEVPELVGYLKERRLYVNDIVENREEEV